MIQIKTINMGTYFNYVTNYIVDFYVKTLGLLVEIDGISHENKIEYDATRQMFLESLGLKVFRVTDGDVKFRILDVMEALESYIVSEFAVNNHPSFGSHY
jgi:very-short-patch-repair endonuclease